jgi:hypothetical protein
MAIWLAPWAGLLAGLAAALMVVYTASAGYGGLRELDRWLEPAGVALGAAAATTMVAFHADGVELGTALLCGVMTGGELTFVWHFLPWLVRDADASAPTSVGSQRAVRGAHPAAVRAALGLVLMLALLMLGLGAVWSRGERQVPAPSLWIVGLAVLTLAVMFVERLAFFERSAREGNLVLPRGSYATWLAAALLTLALAGVLAVAAPWRPSAAQEAARRVGSATVEVAAAAAEASGALQRTAGRAADAMAGLVAAMKAAPLALIALLLLLLLVLIALVVVWAFRRSRAAQWLLAAAAWLIGLLARAWARVRALAAALSAPAEEAGRREPGEEDSDPLQDPFADAELTAGLTDRELILRAYHALLGLAEMLGHGRRQGQTPFEYAQALTHATPAADDPVTALTWAYAGVMYGGGDVGLPPPEQVHRSWADARAALTARYSEEDLDLRRRAYVAARAAERRR